jgi:nicotinamide riboside kinase
MYKIAVTGGSCSGKSAFAAGIFTLCKENNISVELVQEWIREEFNYGWSVRDPSDQFRVLNHQKHKEDIIPDAINVMVTDSPTFLSYFYIMDKIDIYDSHDIAVLTSMYHEFLKEINRYDEIILLERVHDFIKDGTRFGEAKDSDLMFEKMKSIFDFHKVKYTLMNGDSNARLNFFNKLANIDSYVCLD